MKQKGNADQGTKGLKLQAIIGHRVVQFVLKKK